MGLLAKPKIRHQISRDPNNTKWLRDTSTFGQKILRAQGWEPGQYLGAHDAAHSGLHNAANASYIRVTLKDDMNGLGYNKAKEDVVTGLDVFSDVLSRLNGKPEEAVEGQRQARLTMKTNMYVEHKWGRMRFVRGGLLVGEDMRAEKLPSDSSAASGTSGPGDMTTERAGAKKKSKKRKATDLDEHDAASDSKKERKRRKEDKRAKKALRASEDGTSTDGVGAASGNDKKTRKKKSDKDKPSSGQDIVDEQGKPDSADDGRQKRCRRSIARDHLARLSADESELKEAKKDKKDRKRKKRRQEKVDGSQTESTLPSSSREGEPCISTAGTGLSADECSLQEIKKDKRDKKRKKVRQERVKGEQAGSTLPDSSQERGRCSSTAGTGSSTPADTGTGTSTPMGGRNFVRSRFIAAKRQAMLDTKALNQIFMVKT